MWRHSVTNGRPDCKRCCDVVFLLFWGCFLHHVTNILIWPKRENSHKHWPTSHLRISSQSLGVVLSSMRFVKLNKNLLQTKQRKQSGLVGFSTLKKATKLLQHCRACEITFLAHCPPQTGTYYDVILQPHTRARIFMQIRHKR